jgi:hypothetical protein
VAHSGTRETSPVQAAYRTSARKCAMSNGSRQRVRVIDLPVPAGVR